MSEQEGKNGKNSKVVQMSHTEREHTRERLTSNRLIRADKSLSIFAFKFEVSSGETEGLSERRRSRERVGERANNR